MLQISNNNQEKKQGSYTWQSVRQFIEKWRFVEDKKPFYNKRESREQRKPEITSLTLRAHSVFGGTTTKSRGTNQEGKRDSYPWQLVGEQRESENASLNLRAQPVFGGTTKEGKRGSYDV